MGRKVDSKTKGDIGLRAFHKAIKHLGDPKEADTPVSAFHWISHPCCIRPPPPPQPHAHTPAPPPSPKPSQGRLRVGPGACAPLGYGGMPTGAFISVAPREFPRLAPALRLPLPPRGLSLCFHSAPLAIHHPIPTTTRVDPRCRTFAARVLDWLRHPHPNTLGPHESNKTPHPLHASQHPRRPKKPRVLLTPSSQLSRQRYYRPQRVIHIPGHIPNT